MTEKAVAIVCYLVALAGAAAFGALVLLLGCDRLPPRPALAWPWPLLVDGGWLAVFGLQHSGMARTRFKAWWAKFAPARLERSAYAGLAGALLLGLALTWQPLPGPPLWRGPLALASVPLLAGAALAAVNAWHDHFGLFGLRQAWQSAEPPERLLVRGPYRLVRHPLMSCVLIFLWAQPVMPPALLFLSAGLTAYVALGLFLEERDLERRFPLHYAAYRRRVPALLPWRRPAPPGSYP